MRQQTAANRSVSEKVSALGPTWLAGAIAAGPATIAALVTAGASFGYSLLWVVVISALFGAIAQYLATKLALSTEEGLVETVERRLGSKWAWLLVADVVLASGFAQLIIMKTLADVSGLLTGVDARLWGGFWAIVLAIGLAGGGYRIAELGAKVIVSAIVVAFVASLFIVPTDLIAASGGLVPTIPAGVDGALVAAGILGGAVHITIITMQTYTVRARGWTTEDAGLARFDIGISMVAAFGIFSVATFLVVAGALFGNVDPQGLTAVSAAQALEPIAGGAAQSLFLAGLLGAAVSTLGGNTLVPPYVVADKLDWKIDVSDSRYRALLAATALLSAGGAFIGGSFLQQLVLVLAVGTVGTPFVLALVLVLLNDAGTVPESPGALLNIGGILVFTVASVLAGRFISSQIGSGLTPLSGSVLAFGIVLTIATVVLLGLHLRTRLAGGNSVAVSE
ncbi:manganese transport protein [Halohasta litchfieldiae]|jgi:manganese transport protein|uniref:Manganese transport protein n=1 Tax=Halohasta litchfieldiae TaxID=1073996 RepID=A0A1H6REE4_9EURY|nr:divalent metal cation transporter [Halohasta litchfieldiae]ATW89690.1 manganese transport protein [Halohasta litchfieldiae]SEI54199.1 manganese transport protein [Halohasta litchfieldiae]